MTSSKTGLQSHDANIQCIPPTTPSKMTPGKEVRRLKVELEKKDKQNEELLSSIADLNKALSSLTIVKDKIQDAAPADIAKKPKKDKDAPVPAKTAYKFFCTAVPKPEGTDMRLLWKESSADTRQPFVVMADADKQRYKEESAKYEEEKAALEMYYAKKKEDMAMELLDAHVAAQAAAESSAATDAKKKGKNKAAKDPDAPKRPISSYFYFSAEKRGAVKEANPEASVTELSKILGEKWNKLEKGKKGKRGTKKYDDLAAADKKRYVAEKEVYDEKVAQRTAESEQEKIDRLIQDKEEAMDLMTAFKNARDAVTVNTNNATEKLDDMSVLTNKSAVATESVTSVKPKKKKDPNAPKKARNSYIFFVTENRSRIQASVPEGSSQTVILTEVGRQWKDLNDGDKAKYVLLANQDKERYVNDMEKYNASK